MAHQTRTTPAWEKNEDENIFSRSSNQHKKCKTKTQTEFQFCSDLKWHFSNYNFASEVFTFRSAVIQIFEKCAILNFQKFEFHVCLKVLTVVSCEFLMFKVSEIFTSRDEMRRHFSERHFIFTNDKMRNEILNKHFNFMSISNLSNSQNHKILKIIKFSKS